VVETSEGTSPRAEDPGPDRSGGAPTLLGRDDDLRQLTALAGLAGSSPRGLLLIGEAGIGKTALLEHAREAAAAAGTGVLSATGVQWEGEISFSGLNQLLLPARDELARLDRAHHDALTTALGLSLGPPVDPLVLCTATLALLETVAEHRPLLLVVDDLQWIDRATTRVIGFLARRIGGSPIGLLAAARPGTETVLHHAGLPERVLDPLDEQVADTVVRQRFPALPAGVRRRLVREAQGNPLALVELPTALTSAQRAAQEPLPAVLPLSGRLQQLFVHRILQLPPSVKRLLLLAALEGTGDPGLLSGAMGEDWPEALSSAEDTDLIRAVAEPGRVVLRHPLIGSAAVSMATPAERRQAHRALADVMTDQLDRRAWHLAEAAPGPDEDTAALLEQAGHLALQKGDAVRAVLMLLRSADLSPRGDDRARRLAAAAFLGADAAGELRTVPRLLAQARQADPEGRAALPAAVAAGHHLLNGDGDVETARLVLVRAIEGLVPTTGSGPLDEGAPLVEALHSLQLVCAFTGREEPWLPYDETLAALGERAPLVLRVSSRTHGDPARATTTDLEQVDDLVAGIDRERSPTQVVRIAIAAFFIDRLPGCRGALRRVVDDGLEGGAVASALNALMILGHDALQAGRWDEAEALADRGVALGREHGYGLITMPGVYGLALLHAGRGRVDQARACARELTAWAGPRGVRLVEHYACRVRGLAALASEDHDEAYRQFSAICPAGRVRPHNPIALAVGFDLVEAAVRTGRRDAATAHAAALRALPVTAGCPRLGVAALGAAALVDDDHGSELFEEALALPGAEEFPFEHARVRLAHGERLRRLRDTASARQHLASAQQSFDYLGARPWAARAERELRATGLTRGRPHEKLELTFMERQIADLAAGGASNKEIGARLYMSPRTVGSHLYRIFPKLGIASRGGLRDALNGVQGGGAARGPERTTRPAPAIRVEDPAD
jgi:DNA-binding CsgD family transcriptional regulator